MAIIKCKMCGGDIILTEDKTVGICDSCGSTTTFPKIDDEQRAASFNRGNHFRRIGEFDKALAIYERIVQEDDTDAEAHWCCALCRFGIEYVEDPTTLEYLPTCHRASFDSFLEDVDYLAAVEYSDGVTKRQYQKDGAKIAEVQRGILATSQNEEPFDVFICYKESDAEGNRTKDSLMAQDVYYQLTEQGYRVFFSRITLEDMAGKQYEPYIFAALNSAKVMVVIGTSAEYMNAVWVKNEWSRFLAMMKKDRHKLLLPCYRDMDPYDMPDQLSALQAYDMAKIGFIQDLIRGIKKVLDSEKKPEPAKETVVMQQAAANIAPLLKRAFMFLEDGDWAKADDFCEQVLNQDPENAQAYLGKLMADLRVKKQQELKNCRQPFDNNNNYQKTIRFAGDALKKELAGYIAHIKNRNEAARKDSIYDNALTKLKSNQLSACEEALGLFRSIPGWKDADAQAAVCEKTIEELKQKAEADRKNTIYNRAVAQMDKGMIPNYEQAIKLFQSIPGWKDADSLAAECQNKINAIHAKEEAAQLAQKRKERRNAIIAFIAAAVLIAVICFVVNVLVPNSNYNYAVSLMDAGKYEEAIAAFEALDGYKDSTEKQKECYYLHGTALLAKKKYPQAAVAFGVAGDYQDAATQAAALWEKIMARETVSASANYTVGLKKDGTVVAVGSNGSGQCNISEWTDIIAISAGAYHTVGLKADGTVVAVGSNKDGQCDVSEWTDIIAVSAGKKYTVGLKADGTVVAVGSNGSDQCDVEDWTDIVAISAGAHHTVGLKADGTVVAVGDNYYGQCDVDDWTDIVAITAGAYHTVGLKAYGTVVAVGNNDYGQCYVSHWTDIIAISAGDFHTVGLKADGTVVAVGSNGSDQCDVSYWTDVVAISAGDYHTVGLKADGTVVAVGYNEDGQCDVSDWTDIKQPAKRPE